MFDIYKYMSLENLIRYCIVIAIILGFKLFSSLFSKIIVFCFHRFFKIKGKLSESSFYNPLKFYFTLTGIYIGIRVLKLPISYMYFIDKIYRILIILIITRGLSNNFEEGSTLLKNMTRRNIFSNDGFNILFCKCAKFLIYLLSAFIIISEFNYNLGGIVTGLGISGAVIALAAQELIRSIIGGVVIITDKPFGIGDKIKINDFEGVVEDVTFRSIRIRINDGSVACVPNSMVLTGTVVKLNEK